MKVNHTLNILIRAHPQVAGAFFKAERELNSFATRIGGSADALAKTASMVGALDVGFRAVAATSELFKGNVTDAVEELKRMPLLGGLVSSLEAALGSLTGINAEIKKLNEESARQAEDDRRTMEQVAKKRAIIEDITKAWRQLELSRMSASNRALAEAQDAHAERLLKIEQAQFVNTKARNREIERANKLLEEQAKDIGAAARDELLAGLGKMGDQYARIWSDMLQRSADEHKKQTDELVRQNEEWLRSVQQQNDQLIEAQVELQVLQLNAQNRGQEAELLQLREHFRKRLEMAKSEAERETLLRLRAAEEEAIFRKNKLRLDNLGGVAVQTLGNRFVGLSAAARGGQDAIPLLRNMARFNQQIVDEIKGLRRDNKADRVVPIAIG